MKVSYVILLIVLALMNGVYQYSIKKDFKPSELDKYISGTEGLEKALPLGTNIAFTAIDVPPDLHTRIRYLLAPRLLSFYQHNKYDTIITVSSINKKDSVLNALATNGASILWKNQDSVHYYILSSKK